MSSVAVKPAKTVTLPPTLKTFIARRFKKELLDMMPEEGYEQQCLAVGEESFDIETDLAVTRSIFKEAIVGYYKLQGYTIAFTLAEMNAVHLRKNKRTVKYVAFTFRNRGDYNYFNISVKQM